MEVATCHDDESDSANEAPSSFAYPRVECIFNGTWRLGLRDAVVDVLAMGADQWQWEKGIVHSSVAEKCRCLGRLLRRDPRTLGNAARCCYEEKYLICTLEMLEKAGRLMLWTNERGGGNAVRRR